MKTNFTKQGYELNEKWKKLPLSEKARYKWDFQIYKEYQGEKTCNKV